MEDQITGTVDEKTGQIDAPTLKILGLPNLRKLDTTEEMIDADKIQKARDRTAQKIQEIKAKVDSYLEKAKLDDLSRDPDIVNEQIERAERQMHRIAKFICNEMIDDDKEDGEKEDSNATYAEKLEHVKDVLNQGIKEVQKKKEKLTTKYNQSEELKEIQQNIKKVINIVFNLEQQCTENKDLLLSQDETFTNESKLKNMESLEAVLNQVWEGLNSEIRKIEADSGISSGLANTYSKETDIDTCKTMIEDSIWKCSESVISIEKIQQDINKQLNATNAEVLNPKVKTSVISSSYGGSGLKGKFSNKTLQLESCDKLTQMTLRWDDLCFIYNRMKELGTSIDTGIRQLLDRVEQSQDLKEDLKMCNWAIDVINTRVIEDYDYIMYHPYDPNIEKLKDSYNASLSYQKRLCQKAVSLKLALSKPTPSVKIHNDKIKRSILYEVNDQFASSVIADFNSMINKEILSLKDSIITEMKNVKELADEVELYGASRNIAEYASKLNFEGVLFSDKIRNWVSKIKEQAIKHRNNFIKNITQNYGSNSKGAADVSSTGFKSIQSCKENLTKICDELDVLKVNLNIVDNVQIKMCETYNKDIDRLKNSVLTNRASLIKLKSQISCELSGVDKNNEDFKTKEKTKSDLLARVDDMIGFVKQTNDVIREYNQKAVKDSYVLRGKITRKEGEIILNQELLEYTSAQLDNLKKMQERINQIKVQNSELIDKPKVIDLFSSEYKGCKVIIRKNDLTKEVVDAIVNPANEQLEHAGGAAFAIRCAGGDIINDESREYIKKNGKLLTCCAMVTNAGDLPCKGVIHAVGPRFNEASIDHTFEEILMAKTITAILDQMLGKNYKSVSIPAISTGVFKFPLTKFAVTCTKAIKEFIENHEQEMKNRKIILCNNDDDTTNKLLEVVPKVLEFKPEKEKSKKDKKDTSDNDDEEQTKDKVKKCKKCEEKIKDVSHQKNGKNLKICKNCYEENSNDELKSSKIKKNKKKDDSDEEEEKEEKKDKKEKKKTKRNQEREQNESEEENLKESKKSKNNKFKTVKAKKDSNSESLDEDLSQSKKNKKDNESDEDEDMKKTKKSKKVKKDKKKDKKKQDESD